MCDYTVNRPLVSVFLLLICAITSCLTFPILKSPPLEVKGEVATVPEASPKWNWNLFNSVTTTTASRKPTVLTVSEGDPFAISCLKGTGTKCTSSTGASSACKFTWFKAVNKKHLMALRPWTASRLLEKSGLLTDRDLQGSFEGYRGKPTLVVRKATREHAGMYICRVRIEGSDWKKALGVSEGFERKFLVRVTSKRSEALMSNEVESAKAASVQEDHESEEDREEAPPVALEFGMIKYFFGLGSMLGNLAFFGVCLTLLPCLCCSGLSSLCCC